MDFKSKDIHLAKLLKMWLEALWEGFNAELDGETRNRILEHCGRACARYHESVSVAKEITRASHDIDDVIGKLNQIEDLWCGAWHRDDNVISSYCTSCGCPLVLSGIVELSSDLCRCSCGWVKVIFETILAEPVNVELGQAIGRGDPICEFNVEADIKLEIRNRP